MNVSILAIGNELLDGAVIESNSNTISEELQKIKLSILRKIIVRDSRDEIIDALEFLKSRSDIIIITGGLGPTEDDKTRESVALFLGKKLVFDPGIFGDISSKFLRLKVQMPLENRKQAEIIEGSLVLKNPRGTAPGFIISGPPVMAAFPGVPSELANMLPDFTEFLLKNYPIKKNNTSIYVKTIGDAESLLDETLKGMEDKSIVIGTVANYGQVDLRFDVPEADENKALEIVKNQIRAFPEICRHIFSYNRKDTIASAVLRKMKETKKHFITAESCTGGLVSKLFTDSPGSSEAFLGSVVTYDNILKNKVLEVPDAVLREHGAVSFECASAMLAGLRRITDADYYVSVTGIAGPDGGSSEKPVGTVYIGFAKGQEEAVIRFQFNGQRENIRYRSAMRVFEMLWEDLSFGAVNYHKLSSLAEIRTNQEGMK
jgi:nicotinamide-nucleotide amidase